MQITNVLEYLENTVNEFRIRLPMQMKIWK